MYALRGYALCAWALRMCVHTRGRIMRECMRALSSSISCQRQQQYGINSSMYRLKRKAEKFSRRCSVGYSALDAYREAYHVSGWEDYRCLPIANRLAGRADVQARIAELQAEALSAVAAPVVPAVPSEPIADSFERQAIWTSILRDTNERTRDRLAASELLGKAQQDFVTQIESRSIEVKADLSTFTLEELRHMLTMTEVTSGQVTLEDLEPQAAFVPKDIMSLADDKLSSEE